MTLQIHKHLAAACKAAHFAFIRSSKKGESLEEILGLIDPLTGVPNRRSFEENRDSITAFQTFILIDVDNLKQLNDTFGHLFGDKVLQSCGRILSKAVQKVGKAYRLGGDEFALVVPQCWVKTVCMYIKSAIREDSRFSISMGIGPVCGTDGLTDAIFNAAETSLYQCKNREADIYTEFLTDDLATPPGEIYIEENENAVAAFAV